MYPINKLFSYWIPTSSDKLAESEQQVLSYIKTPYHQHNVIIDNNNNYINTLHFKNNKTDSNIIKTPLVLIHGFGAGNGFWLLNFDTLSQHYTDVYSIDLLGCGRSSRPRFNAKNVEETEEFFTNSIEQWRNKLHIDHMILCGHSLGAYISTVYTLKYSQHVKTLILASPVGVPEEPSNVEQAYSRYTRANPTIPWYYRFAREYLRKLWDWGYTPQSIVRLMGPWGSQPVTSYVMRRFYMGAAVQDNDSNNNNTNDNNSAIPNSVRDSSGIEAADAITKQIDSNKTLRLPKQQLAEYLYHLCAAPGSGEYGITKILKPTVYAHLPLIQRMPELGKTNVNVQFLYGSVDWMDVNAGKKTSQLINQNGGKSNVHIIPDAGHQLMIDNAPKFNQAVIDCSR